MKLQDQLQSETFDIFISYSRKNAEFARGLEKALEGFKPPKSLEVPQRRLKVFRDEGDLIGIEYFTSIERYLKNSAKMVVVCSPAACGSEYVNDEIQRFVKAQGKENLIPIIVDGIPNNEAKSDQVDQMAFPDALTQQLGMPLATDYLGFKSGKDKVQKGHFESSWYSLLSNVYDIERHEVEERERKHRQRKRTISTAILLTIIVALATLATTAWRQKLEAEKQTEIAITQKAEAEHQAELARRGTYNIQLARARDLVARDPMKALVLLNDKNLAPEDLRDFTWGFLHRLAKRDKLTLTGLKDVRSFAFSPEGKTLALTFSNQISFEPSYVKLLNSVTGEKLASPQGRLVAVSQDFKVFALANEKKSIKLKVVETGVEGSTIKGGEVFSVFSPDKKYLASVCGPENRTIIWRASTGEKLAEFDGAGDLFPPSYSPDSRILAITDGVNVTLWDLEKRERLFGNNIPDNYHDLGAFDKPTLENLNFVTSVAFSPDSKTLATADNDSSIKLWDLDTGRRLTSLNSHTNNTIMSVAFSPTNDNVLASGDADGTVKFWDIGSRQELLTFRGHDTFVNLVAFSQDGKTLASGDNNGTVKLWDLEVESVHTIPPGHVQSFPSVSFSPGSHTLAIYGKDIFELWDVTNFQESKVINSGNLKDSFVSFSPDANIIVLRNRDKKIKLWDVANEREPMTLEGDTQNISSVSFSHDDKILVAANTGGTVKRWNIASGKMLAPTNLPNGSRRTLALSPDAQILVSDEETGGVKLWNIGSGGNAVSLKNPRSYVDSLVFSPDGKTLATLHGREGGQLIELWDSVTGDLRFTIDEGFGQVQAIAFSPDGQTLAMSGEDGEIKLLDAATGLERGTLEGGKNEICSVAFSPDGQVLVSASIDGTIKLWKADNWKNN